MKNNKLVKNIALKIISLIVAFVFWVVIVNVIDPMTEKEFQGIPVSVLNENVITNANQVYEITSGDTVDLVVRGKRSFVEGLSSKDFEATADLSELSKVNAVTINVELKKITDSDYEIDTNNAVMKLNLEERVSGKFKVEIESQGTLSENYEIGEMVAKPNILEVSCGKSKFNKIDHVAVIVNLDGESEDFEQDYSPVIYDKNGDIIDSTDVTYSRDSVSVSTQVLLTKELDVKVNALGKPASGYHLLETDFQPETIKVSGSSNDLKKYSSITIPISIEGAKGAVEKEVSVEDYLPSGLSVVGDNNTVTIRCDIEKSGKRSFVLTAADIAVKNLPANHNIQFSDENMKCQVILSGKNSTLKKLQITDLNANIDLTNLGTGQHTVEVLFDLPSGVKLKKAVTVDIVLISQDGTSTETTATSAPTSMPEDTKEPSASPKATEKSEDEKEEETKE
ncbi:MAG: hypothetical protein K6G62_04015 [Eubacterium sp.]|nr:hypothetical protein [Eubacterium sp.]